MLTLIHGADRVTSRNKITDLLTRDENTEKIFLDGTKTELSDLVINCESASIFNNKKVIIIENLLSQAKSKETDNLLNYLLKLKTDNSIIIWEGKEIDKVKINKHFQSVTVILCQLPQNIFKFLETIGLESPSISVNYFHSLLNTYDADFIFNMILRQLRLLMIIKDEKSRNKTNLANWQISRLNNQARIFKIEELISLYRQLLVIDTKIKTGQTPYTYKEFLDIFLLNF